MTGETGISVSELNMMVAEAIRRDPRTRSVTVHGEVSGFKQHLSTGHWYFNLKDAQAAVSCVMFRTAAVKAKIRPSDGDQVLAQGYVDVYSPQGKYQLYVTGLRKAGLGDLYVRLEALKQKLAAEGLFDPGRKRPLPIRPRKVAVVTSQSGAALHDILNVSGMRCPSVPIVLVPVAVQGTGAGREIADGIRRADSDTDAEVIIVARGGGSAEDLWCFNDEAVVRAVAGCGKPVVSGVGHEVDTTLCDLAADVRASTPSNAAEIVFPDRRDLAGRIELVRSSLVKVQTGIIQTWELKLQKLKQHMTALSPEKRIALLTSRTELCRDRICTAIRIRTEAQKLSVRDSRTALTAAISSRLQEAAQKKVRLQERLSAVNPMAVLNRGYALVYDQNEKLVTRASDARKTDEMNIQFSDGRVAVTGKDAT